MLHFHIIICLVAAFITCVVILVTIIFRHVQLCLTYAFELYFGLGVWLR